MSQFGYQSLGFGGGVAAAAGYALDGSYSIATTPFIHWDASSITGITDGNTFATWTSREGNAYDLAQATADDQFTYDASSSTMNNAPTVKSSDGDRYMGTATSFLPADTVTFPITVISAVYRASGMESSMTMPSQFSGKNLSTDGIYVWQDASPRIAGHASLQDYYMLGSGGGASYTRGSSTNMAAGAQIFTWEMDAGSGGDSAFYLNLAKSTSFAATGSVDFKDPPFNYQFFIGARVDGTGPVEQDWEMGEIIIFNELLDDTSVTSNTVDGGQLHTIITYLKSKYGIS